MAEAINCIGKPYKLDYFFNRNPGMIEKTKEYLKDPTLHQYSTAHSYSMDGGWSHNSEDVVYNSAFISISYPRQNPPDTMLWDKRMGIWFLTTVEDLEKLLNKLQI